MLQNFSKIVIVSLIKLIYITCNDELGNLTDLSRCILSHLGLEYRGEIQKTESGVPCQAWDSEKPVHKVNISFIDEKFSDFSKKNAMNYCRNPSLHPDGPWCYSMEKNNINETCMIPLCSFSECKATGPGMEYSGKHKRGLSDRKCLKWNKKRKKVRHDGNITEIEKYAAHKFPENDLSDASKFCRNPSGDVGGPWCFVEVEDSNEVEREYCDVPFCEDQECTVFTKETPIYSHFAAFESTQNFTFGLRLWDSDSFLNTSAKLLLSVLALPTTGNEVKELGFGIEIHISTTKVALTYGNKDDVHYEKLENPLVSHKYQFFSLNWDKGIITFSREGAVVPIFMAEIQTKNNLLGYHKDAFSYYSAMGENMLWSFPFCDDDDVCDIQTTTSEHHQQFWPLGRTDLGFDLKFYIRAFHSGYILLVPSPAVKYPALKIMLDKKDGFTEVVHYPRENEPPNVLVKHTLNEFLLDYWKWAEFTLAIFADNLQLFSTRDIGTLLIIDLRHESIRQIRWFSPASNDSVAHWTFSCAPLKSANPPPAFLPECALEMHENTYKGTQDLTNEGIPCLPWSGKGIPSNDFFNDKNEVLKTRNYCRNPLSDDLGSYCYTFSRTREIVKSYCHIRPCKSQECRLAGTGNDYVGKLNITRSNRSCMAWTATSFKSYNETLFADKKIEDAKNYCRNPTRNLAGSWCYTNDSRFRYDICNVRDCDKPEECIVIIRQKGTDIHILPQWKAGGAHGGLHFAAKQWNPDQQIGAVFEFKSLEKDQSMKLVIGEKENEKVQMYYNSYLVKEKTLSHLMHSGKWTSFWLQIRKGEIALGYEDVETALFEWTHDYQNTAFEPIFMSYMSLFLSPLGLFFNCDECHIENVTNSDFLKLFPLGLRRKDRKPLYNSICFKLRGIGVFNVLLSALPDVGLYHLIKISDDDVSIYKVDFNKRNKMILLKLEKMIKGPLLRTNSWTNLHISFQEQELNVSSEEALLFRYNSSDEPLVFYWFSVGSEKGWVVWVANCVPLDIDGPPLDGGWSKWSPWQCTVTCGGGEGFRTRNCTNPSPNIFGQQCHGSPKSVGTCNDFPCGDISPATIESIQQDLKTTQVSLIVNEEDSLFIEANNEITSKIHTESPEATFMWTLNGLLVEKNKNRTILKNNSISISKTSEKDVGVYAFVLKRINKQKLIIRTVTLAVVSKTYDISTRATSELILHSKAMTLGHIYIDLSQKWLLNNTTYIDYGITTLSAVATERIKPLNASHSGEWRCVVEQLELGLFWVTNIVKVEVKKAPNFYTHLMEDKLTAPIFARFKTEKNIRRVAALFFITLFLLLTSCTGFYLLLRKMPIKKIKKKSKYKRNRRL
ncbi:uncharacterized protein LOC108742562 isoform X2 [Agrilus planipennis]|uniref:Uncharacterized protein LOC108742562 isoform X2 n=1 Tax=Agrilus planipennis TaxID=224129 RepID=A0A1W4XKM2_AGRPL|nr:uncharacterized protein LOC108742562 isoform X2 [Agrilus planipennis]